MLDPFLAEPLDDFVPVGSFSVKIAKLSFGLGSAMLVTTVASPIVLSSPLRVMRPMNCSVTAKDLWVSCKAAIFRFGRPRDTTAFPSPHRDGRISQSTSRKDSAFS